MAKGWVVAVEDAEGDLLYVVATDNPLDAEAIVTKNLNLSPDIGVQAISQTTAKDLAAFKLERGEMRGPM